MFFKKKENKPKTLLGKVTAWSKKVQQQNEREEAEIRFNASCAEEARKNGGW